MLLGKGHNDLRCMLQIIGPIYEDLREVVTNLLTDGPMDELTEKQTNEWIRETPTLKCLVWAEDWRV